MFAARTSANLAYPIGCIGAGWSPSIRGWFSDRYSGFFKNASKSLESAIVAFFDRLGIEFKHRRDLAD